MLVCAAQFLQVLFPLTLDNRWQYVVSGAYVVDRDHCRSSKRENLWYSRKKLESRACISCARHQQLQQVFQWLVGYNNTVTRIYAELTWKGSDNQELYVFDKAPEIVGRYEMFKEKRKDKRLQMVMRGEKIYIIGIPWTSLSLPLFREDYSWNFFQGTIVSLSGMVV